MSECIPEISVIVAAYNVEKEIGECLESLQNQTYEDFEVLVIDDGSTDNTPEQVKLYLLDDRFHYYRKENSSQGGARNYALDRIRGSRFVCVDGDDTVTPDFLMKLHEQAELHPDSTIVCGIARVYEGKSTYQPITEKLIRLFQQPRVCNTLISREAVEKYRIRFPERSWYEDLCFSTCLLMTTDSRCAIINEPLYLYRQKTGSTMHTYDDRIFDIYAIMDKTLAFARKYDLLKKNYHELEYAAVYHVLVGTTFRASFHSEFTKDRIKYIHDFVEERFPKWYKNPYIKTEMSFSFRVFLFLMHNKGYGLIRFLFITFHNYVSIR